MDDRAALFANVLNAPADDTARLVLADWLEENDEETFGQFLRAGVVAARFRGTLPATDPNYSHAIETIAEVASAGAPARWLSNLGIGPMPLTPGDWASDHIGDRLVVWIGGAAGVFARGMLSELVLPAGNWYEVAPAALANWPLARVTVTDTPGLVFLIDPPVDEPG